MVDRIPLHYVLALSQMPLATAMIVAADNVPFWAGRDVSSVVRDVDGNPAVAVDAAGVFVLMTRSRLRQATHVQDIAKLGCAVRWYSARGETMVEEQFYDREQRMLESADPVEVKKAEKILQERNARHPDDALVQFLIASAFDGADREGDAMHHYERAMASGIDTLPKALQPKIYLQGGSTLRNLGRIQEARTLLQEGISRFPHFRALTAFLALAETSAGHDRKAVVLLLSLLVTDDDGDTSLLAYRRALSWYAQEIETEE